MVVSAIWFLDITSQFTRSLEAIQNHAMIEEENKELRKQVEEVSFSRKIIIH